MNFYNDNDPKICAWLRELIAAKLIPDGVVDSRSITLIQPHELKPYTQCHFFAGIGGWPEALRLAGWPTDVLVWTGSCPCQPYSCAGKGKGNDDPRNVWPHFRRLIEACHPPVVFGEQVASKAGREWLDAIGTDLERMDFEFGAAGLCAYAVNAPHERMRAFWVANSSVNGRKRIQQCATPQIQKNWTPETLGPWNPTGSPFQNWKKLLAKSHVGRVDDGVSSGLDIRPRLRAYGNAIVPQVAAEFIGAYMDLFSPPVGRRMN